MKNAMIAFNFGDQLVRSQEIKGDIWFVAADVAKILNYAQAKDLTRMLDEDEKGRHLMPTLGGDQEVEIISESGLYHAMIKSRSEKAKPFRKWITSEVLPSIRKTGSYSTTQQNNEHRNHLLLLKLTKELTIETNNQRRYFIIAQAQSLCAKLGLDGEQLHLIGKEAPQQPERVNEFWELVEYLIEQGEKLNHSRNPGVIALRLPEVIKAAGKHKQKINAAGLHQDLRLSQDPKFLDTKTVASGVTAKSVKAWVFEQIDF